MFHITVTRDLPTEFIVAAYTVVISHGEIAISTLATEHVKYQK